MGDRQGDPHDQAPLHRREPYEEKDYEQLACLATEVHDGVEFFRNREPNFIQGLQYSAHVWDTKRRNNGCSVLVDKWDGPHYDLVVKPPLWVMLNLCGSLLDDVEVMWSLIRMGMADAQKPDKREMYCPDCRQIWRPQAAGGSVRICELTNARVHEHCWKLHLKKQTMEYLCRGLKKLSSMWYDFVEYKKAKRRASEEGAG